MFHTASHAWPWTSDVKKKSPTQ